jgi:phage tail-like protein
MQAIRIFFPRDSYAQYLPAVYREDEQRRRFLERFLAIFQTEFDAIEDHVENLWRLLDSATVPAEYLRGLAAWLALPPQLPAQEGLLRQIVKQAAEADRVRGTPKGLEDAVQTYTGVPARVLEHFRLRRWPGLAVAAPLDGSAPLWSRDFYRRLQLTSYSQVGFFQLTDSPEPILEPLHWGAHQFSVFFPANPYSVATTQQHVSAVVEREKPAHTTATLCPVYSRMRVGIQATVGVDSRIGEITYLTLNRLGTLGYDSILSGSAAEGSLRSLGQTVRQRAGISTRLQ